MPSITVKDDGGVLRHINTINVKDSGGVLRRVRFAHVKDGAGNLLLVFGGGTSGGSITGSVGVDIQDLQLDSLAILAGWDGSSIVNFVCVISAGVYVRASSTGVAALNTGPSWPSGSTITIINYGIIAGFGGAGGDGGVGPSTTPTAGSGGGPAIILQAGVTIDNTYGYIFGGGGGGGGGNLGYRSCGLGKSFQQCYASGGGGGGGAGGGPGGGSIGGNPGGPGSNTALFAAGGGGGGGADLACCGGGFAGNAGAGGDWGQPGIAAGAAAGGAGGAIAKFGQSLTITGGNTPTQVKGAIA